MLRKLGVRLALSHALPVLATVLILGAALLYQLERRYLLDTFAIELAAQGTIIASLTRDEPALWRSPLLAQLVIDQLAESSTTQIMLIDPAGRILAATGFQGETAEGLSDNPVVQTALGGQASWSVDYSMPRGDQIMDVAVPVSGHGGQVVGVVRLSHSLDEIQQRLQPMRLVVLVALLIGGGFSLILGLFLARSLAAPLTRLTTAVAGFNPLRAPPEVPETGPDEIRSLAATFNHMGRRLHELERTRAALLSGVVHELGRPLGAIKAAAQTIANSHNTVPMNEALIHELASGISDYVDQLRYQIDDLALLAEVEVQGLTVHLEPVDLGELIYSQCQRYSILAKQRRLTLDCRPNPELPLIQADPHRLDQILGNVIHNACKYTAAGGSVTVAAELAPMPDQSPGVAVAVADSGPGIPPQEQERVFEFFYRSPSHRRIHQGMGIGLALARQLAEAHGGSLTLQSSVEAGSTFTLRLPLGPSA